MGVFLAITELTGSILGAGDVASGLRNGFQPSWAANACQNCSIVAKRSLLFKAIALAMAFETSCEILGASVCAGISGSGSPLLVFVMRSSASAGSVPISKLYIVAPSPYTSLRVLVPRLYCSGAANPGEPV